MKQTTLCASLVRTVSVLAILTFSVAAFAKLNRAGSSSAGFHVAGPAGMNIDGTTGDVGVADDGTTVTITVNLSNIKTGIGIRDDHTKNYLEVQTYPTAELKVARASLKFPAAGGDANGDAPGKMTIHGQTRDVTFHYTATLNADTYDVKGSSRVNMNDYGIKTPSYLGVSVKPDVSVFANFQVKDN